MNKREIAKKVADEHNLTVDRSLDIVQLVFDQITDSLVKEGRIELRDFGIFDCVHKNARKARNPKTGADIFVPESYRVKFKPGKEMLVKIFESRGVKS
jgi:nucleoid DNA-binding protein